MQTVAPVYEYIAEGAAQRGIDPAVALRVAKSKGLNQCTGDSGSSFGLFQRHYGGVASGGNRVAGIGGDFTKATTGMVPGTDAEKAWLKKKATTPMAANGGSHG